MCARRRRFERMSEGETKKNPKRKRVKRLEKERKKERKTEEEEGRNSTETVQKQSMPIKCFVALQWKIFSFVLWKFSRRVEAASFSHSFISTLDQCALFGKHEKRWESKYLQLKCWFFFRQFVCKIFFLFESMSFLRYIWCIFIVYIWYDGLTLILLWTFLSCISFQISWFQTVVLLQEIRFVWILSMGFQSVIHSILWRISTPLVRSPLWPFWVHNAHILFQLLKQTTTFLKPTQKSNKQSRRHLSF